MAAIIAQAGADARHDARLGIGQGELTLLRLLKSYDTVLRAEGMVPEEDTHYYRFLLKLSLDPVPNWWDKLSGEQRSCLGDIALIPSKHLCAVPSKKICPPRAHLHADPFTQHPSTLCWPCDTTDIFKASFQCRPGTMQLQPLAMDMLPNLFRIFPATSCSAGSDLALKAFTHSLPHLATRQVHQEWSGRIGALQEQPLQSSSSALVVTWDRRSTCSTAALTMATAFWNVAMRFWEQRLAWRVLVSWKGLENCQLACVLTHYRARILRVSMTVWKQAAQHAISLVVHSPFQAWRHTKRRARAEWQMNQQALQHRQHCCQRNCMLLWLALTEDHKCQQCIADARVVLCGRALRAWNTTASHLAVLKVAHSKVRMACSTRAALTVLCSWRWSCCELEKRDRDMGKARSHWYSRSLAVAMHSWSVNACACVHERLGMQVWKYGLLPAR
jgi:hypothetical protein